MLVTSWYSRIVQRRRKERGRGGLEFSHTSAPGRIPQSLLQTGVAHDLSVLLSVTIKIRA